MLSDAGRHATPLNGGNPRTGVAQERSGSTLRFVNGHLARRQ
ncbi:MAG: hypothetical protein RMY34_23830 [Aulosira sp. DedQUE10]|nr:hypothetical protein [Aulosira sp. DedQUE10]